MGLLDKLKGDKKGLLWMSKTGCLRIRFMVKLCKIKAMTERVVCIEACREGMLVGCAQWITYEDHSRAERRSIFVKRLRVVPLQTKSS